MQNFTTTLHKELVNKKSIFLPSGYIKFILVDVTGIGNVTASILANIDAHQNKAYELTSSIKLTFTEMAQELNRRLEVYIYYTSPSLFNFYFTKRKEQQSIGFILVSIMLHYFTRLQQEATTTD